MSECGWDSGSCGALALRWGCCDKMTSACLRKSSGRGVTAKAQPLLATGAIASNGSAAPGSDAATPADPAAA